MLADKIRLDLGFDYVICHVSGSAPPMSDDDDMELPWSHVTNFAGAVNGCLELQVGCHVCSGSRLSPELGELFYLLTIEAAWKAWKSF